MLVNMFMVISFSIICFNGLFGARLAATLAADAVSVLMIVMVFASWPSAIQQANLPSFQTMSKRGRGP
jgi:hypothetical protein